MNNLKAWNHITDAYVRPGQTLNLKSNLQANLAKPSSSIEAGWTTHTVEKGESLWTISRRYSVSIDQLIEWNQIDRNNITLYPGNSLRIRTIKL